MIENVQAFINHINDREHVLLLIEDAEITISFIEKEETATISLYHGEIKLTNDLNKINNIIIKGNRTSFEELLEGRETLRMLVKRGSLQVSAPFRTLLLLESLFYYGKTPKTY